MTIALVLLCVLFMSLSGLAWVYNRLMWRRARAHQWWNHVDSCRYERHDIVRELLDMSHVPLQHAMSEVTALSEALAHAQVATGMDHVLQAEMALTDTIVDLENAIDLRPPRYEAGRIRLQTDLLDGADRKLDEARRTYNKSAEILNKSLEHPLGRLVGGLFRMAPLPYFHHTRDDQGEVPPEALEAPEKMEPPPG